MKLIEAAKEILTENPKTRDNKYLWLYMIEVLRKMGFKVYILFDGNMPSPESILKERRHILNKLNTFSKDFVPEEGISYEKPQNN